MAQAEKDDKYYLAPKKFNMWIFIFTSFMFFAALTSGFIVYTGGKAHGINLILPKVFMYNTIAIVLSSVTFFIASRAAKSLELGKQRIFLWLTLFLGVVFFAGQIYAWGLLIKMGVYFVNPNAGQSFIYVFTGMHLLHILAGLILLSNTLYKSYRGIPQARNLFNMQFSGIFWHFVDIIWIYLYVFLLLNQY